MSQLLRLLSAQRLIITTSLSGAEAKRRYAALPMTTRMHLRLLTLPRAYGTVTRVVLAEMLYTSSWLLSPATWIKRARYFNRYWSDLTYARATHDGYTHASHPSEASGLHQD